jgi:hypothetical protein
MPVTSLERPAQEKHAQERPAQERPAQERLAKAMTWVFELSGGVD